MSLNQRILKHLEENGPSFAWEVKEGIIEEGEWIDVSSRLAGLYIAKRVERTLAESHETKGPSMKYRYSAKKQERRYTVAELREKLNVYTDPWLQDADEGEIRKFLDWLSKNP